MNAQLKNNSEADRLSPALNQELGANDATQREAIADVMSMFSFKHPVVGKEEVPLTKRGRYRARKKEVELIKRARQARKDVRRREVLERARVTDQERKEALKKKQEDARDLRNEWFERKCNGWIDKRVVDPPIRDGIKVQRKLVPKPIIVVDDSSDDGEEIEPYQDWEINPKWCKQIVSDEDLWDFPSFLEEETEKLELVDSEGAGVQSPLASFDSLVSGEIGELINHANRVELEVLSKTQTDTLSGQTTLGVCAGLALGVVVGMCLHGKITVRHKVELDAGFSEVFKPLKSGCMALYNSCPGPVISSVVTVSVAELSYAVLSNVLTRKSCYLLTVTALEMTEIGWGQYLGEILQRINTYAEGFVANDLTQDLITLVMVPYCTYQSYGHFHKMNPFQAAQTAKSMSEWVDTLKDFLLKYLGDSLVVTGLNATDLLALSPLISRAEKLKLELRTVTREGRPKLKRKVAEWASEAVEFMKRSTGAKFNQVYRVYLEIMSITRERGLDVAMTTADFVKPTGVLLMGDTSMGKSTITKLLASALICGLGNDADGNPIDDPVEHFSERVYVCNPAAKHFDTVGDQDIWVVDDWAVTRKEHLTAENVANMLMHLINEVPKRLEVAHLENKDLLYCLAKVVICSANVSVTHGDGMQRLDVLVQNMINYPKALIQRFKYAIVVTATERYRNDAGMLDLDKVKAELIEQGRNPDSFLEEAVTLSIVDLNTITAMKPVGDKVLEVGVRDFAWMLIREVKNAATRLQVRQDDLRRFGREFIADTVLDDALSVFTFPTKWLETKYEEAFGEGSFKWFRNASLTLLALGVAYKVVKATKTRRKKKSKIAYADTLKPGDKEKIHHATAQIFSAHSTRREGPVEGTTRNKFVRANLVYGWFTPIWYDGGPVLVGPAHTLMSMLAMNTNCMLVSLDPRVPTILLTVDGIHEVLKQNVIGPDVCYVRWRDASYMLNTVATRGTDVPIGTEIVITFVSPSDGDRKAFNSMTEPGVSYTGGGKAYTDRGTATYHKRGNDIKGGNSGSPILVKNAKGAFEYVGFHGASMDHYAILRCIVSSDYEELDASIFGEVVKDFPEPTPSGSAPVLVETSFTVPCGPVECFSALRPYTDISLYEDIYRELLALDPNWSKTKVKRPLSHKALNAAFSCYGGYQANMNLIQEDVEYVIHDILDFNLPNFDYDVDLSPDEALMKMDVTKSMGHGFSTKEWGRGKTEIWYEGKPGPKYGDWMMLRERRLVEIEAGIADPIIFEGRPKDETCDPSKAGKARYIAGQDMYGTQIGNEIFGHMLEEIMGKNIYSEMCLGMNPTSHSWHHMWNLLSEFGKDGFAGDLAKCDRTVPAGFLKCLRDVLVSKIRSSRKKKIVKWFLDSLIRSLHDVCGQLWLVAGTNCSGNTLTTFINMVWVLFLVRLGFMTLCNVKVPMELPQKLMLFHKYVKVRTYGDDHVVVPHEKIKHLFNFSTFKNFLKSLGIGYTDHNGEDHGGTVWPLGELGLLKRTSKITVGGYQFGALSVVSIRKMIEWWKEDTFAYQQTVKMVLREAALHGEPTYNLVVDLVNRVRVGFEVYAPSHAQILKTMMDTMSVGDSVELAPDYVTRRRIEPIYKADTLEIESSGIAQGSRLSWNIDFDYTSVVTWLGPGTALGEIFGFVRSFVASSRYPLCWLLAYWVHAINPGNPVAVELLHILVTPSLSWYGVGRIAEYMTQLWIKGLYVDKILVRSMARSILIAQWGLIHFLAPTPVHRLTIQSPYATHCFTRNTVRAMFMFKPCIGGVVITFHDYVLFKHVNKLVGKNGYHGGRARGWRGHRFKRMLFNNDINDGTN